MQFERNDKQSVDSNEWRGVGKWQWRCGGWNNVVNSRAVNFKAQKVCFPYCSLKPEKFSICFEKYYSRGLTEVAGCKFSAEAAELIPVILSAWGWSVVSVNKHSAKTTILGLKEVLVSGMETRALAEIWKAKHLKFTTFSRPIWRRSNPELCSLSPQPQMQVRSSFSVKESTCIEEQIPLMLRSSLSTHLPCSRKLWRLCRADLSARCKDQIGSFYLPRGGAASLSALPLEGVYLACW